MSHEEHNHHHSHLHEHNHDTGNIKIAFFLNLFFTMIEIVGGFLTNSIAILSDAVHDLGDSIALGLAWYFQKFSHKSSDKHFTYGYKRFSLVGALINSIILVIGSVLILTEAIPRLFTPQHSNPKGMFILAIFGIIVNGIAMLRLRKGHSLNEKVVSLHMLEDVLGWLAILIGSVVMYFFYVPVLDPILSILISIYVLFNVFKNIRELARIILQGTPQEIEPDEIIEQLRKFEQISSIHDLHLWSVDGTYNVLTIHVVLNSTQTLTQLAELKCNIRRTLQKIGIEHVTIEFETPDEKCVFEDCCQ
ncbi:MAG: cation diffusion facilitator family transporter [Bacteroidetes bacterium]|nr:cation diffusion facilitator family transporter [Bacteroidota bacterium]